MGTYKKVASDAFESMQLDAGIVLSTFNPSTPAVTDSAIITATTGGIKVSCVPSFTDLGEDIDNCPKNTKELKHIDSWECKMEFTALNVNASTIALALGASTTTSNKTVPDTDLAIEDFKDIWWVGDTADGGAVAVCLKNSLSSGGLQMQSTDKGKGQLTVELTGHFSMNAQTTVPMEFYVLSA